MFVSLFLEAVAKYCVKKRIEHAIEKGERVADGFNSVYKFATVRESRIEPEAKIYHVYWQRKLEFITFSKWISMIL